MLIPSAPTAVDELAYRIASLVSTDLKDGVPAYGSI